MISSKSYTSKSYIHFQICIAYFRHHKLTLQSTFALSKLITFSHKITSEQNIHLLYLHFSLFTFIIPSISLFFHSKILNLILLSALKHKSTSSLVQSNALSLTLHTQFRLISWLIFSRSLRTLFNCYHVKTKLMSLGVWCLYLTEHSTSLVHKPSGKVYSPLVLYDVLVLKGSSDMGDISGAHIKTSNQYINTQTR